MTHLFLFAAAVASLSALVSHVLFSRRSEHAHRRLLELRPQRPPSETELITRFNDMMRSTLPKMGETLIPKNQEQLSRLAKIGRAHV